MAAPTNPVFAVLSVGGGVIAAVGILLTWGGSLEARAATHAQRIEDRIEARLSRIESKIDAVLQGADDAR